MKRPYHTISEITQKLRENDKLVAWYDDDYEESFHRYDRTLPVIGLLATSNHLGEEFCKLTYYQSPPTDKPIAEENLPMSMSAEEMYVYILEKMYSDHWLEQAEYFISDRSFFVDTPFVSLHLYQQSSRTSHSFQVRVDEMIPNYMTTSGDVLSTKTIFDLAISTKTLEVYEWYDLQFGVNHKDMDFSFEKSRVGETLFLTSHDSHWYLALSGIVSAQDEYEIQFMPKNRGLSFRVISPDCQRIWFKLGWIKMTNHKTEDCLQALRKWIG